MTTSSDLVVVSTFRSTADAQIANVRKCPAACGGACLAQRAGLGRQGTSQQGATSYFTETWVKDGAQWKAAAAHISRIAPAAAGGGREGGGREGGRGRGN